MKIKDNNALKKLCFYILIMSFLNYVGCYSSRNIDKEILYTQDVGKPAGIVIITMNDNKVFEIRDAIFDLVQDTLYVNGFEQYIDHVKTVDEKFALNDIKSVEIKERDNLATCGLIVGVSALAMLIFFAIALNTPDKSTSSCSGSDVFGK